MTLVPQGSTAVMARRIEPPDSLDFFPTPPWATRALVERVLHQNFILAKTQSAWDPACGAGHMSAVLAEYFDRVCDSDIFDYGIGARVADFLDGRAPVPEEIDWIITNPPFKAAIDFTLRALELARVGVAMLARTQWIESAGRYERLFRDGPPTIFAPFVERVPMVKGRWDPNASTATSYAWYIWVLGRRAEWCTMLIPPGCRRALTKRDDAARFAATQTAEAPRGSPAHRGQRLAGPR